MKSFSLTDSPLKIGECVEDFVDDRAGARVSFEGVVRNHHLGHGVDFLEYEAFPEMVETEGKRILDEARARFSLTDAAAVHRVGRLEIGEVAVWVGTLAEHRQEAFLACRWIMDEIKARLPVWKKETFSHGEVEWVGAATAPTETAAPADLYRRQSRLPEIGEEGQQRLNNAKVLVVGAGGLGCPAMLYLAAAGVGTLTIADGDVVQLSNLHRQVLFTPADLGKGKAALAADRLRAQNPWISVRAVDDYLTPAWLADQLGEHDLVLDCTDNFETRFALNDACWQAGVPLVQAAIHRFEGMVQTFRKGASGGCYRCQWPDAPRDGCVGTCAEAGVLGLTAGLIGAQQAVEAMRQLLDWPGSLENDTLLIDVLSGDTRRLRREARPDCPCQTGVAFPRDPLADHLLRPGPAAARLLREATVIDLREPCEREGNPPHILALASYPRERWPHILDEHPERPLVLACAAGGRTRLCLRDMNFPEGVYAWTAPLSDLPRPHTGT